MEQAVQLAERFWLPIVVYLIAMGCIGLLLGLRRGQGGRGLLIGALLGPIAWFLIPRWETQGDSCPDCGGINPGKPRICRHCGVNVQAAGKRSSRSRVRGVSDGWR